MLDHLEERMAVSGLQSCVIVSMIVCMSAISPENAT
jgi:hypothetical protein